MKLEKPIVIKAHRTAYLFYSKMYNLNKPGAKTLKQGHEILFDKLINAYAAFIDNCIESEPDHFTDIEPENLPEFKITERMLRNLQTTGLLQDFYVPFGVKCYPLIPIPTALRRLERLEEAGVITKKKNENDLMCVRIHKSLLKVSNNNNL